MKILIVSIDSATGSDMARVFEVDRVNIATLKQCHIRIDNDNYKDLADKDRMEVVSFVQEMHGEGNPDHSYLEYAYIIRVKGDQFFGNYFITGTIHTRFNRPDLGVIKL